MMRLLDLLDSIETGFVIRKRELIVFPSLNETFSFSSSSSILIREAEGYLEILFSFSLKIDSLQLILK